jgi:aspartyl/asparaginyl beta-hydroxylase
MICEKIDYVADVEGIRQYFIAEVRAKYPPTMQSESFGGWSIQSSNGEHTDGWARGEVCFEKDASGAIRFNSKKAAEIGLRPTREYVKDTPLCVGPVRKLMDDVSAMGFMPARARFTLLPAQTAPFWHRDAEDEAHMTRLHVPIITNKLCVFLTEEGGQYMPADGSVFVLRTNRLHAIENLSDEDRIHIIMDVWDTKGVTKHHRYVEPSFVRSAAQSLMNSLRRRGGAAVAGS